MPQVNAQELQTLARKIFEGLRVPPQEAAWVAELLVRANLVGHDSHGVIRVPQYAEAIKSGQVQPGAAIEMIRESPATALVDGHWGLGQVVARRAMELAIQKAKTAVNFRRPTKVLEDALMGGRTIILSLPGATPIEGGLPITVDEKVIGAIGVSGVTAPQDGQIAKAGTDALPKILGK